jgi:hypothetical protein
MRKARIEGALLAAVLGMFVPGFARAEPAGADAAKSGLSTAVTTTPRGRPVMSKAGPAASTTFAPMQNRQAIPVVPRVTTNSRVVANISRAPSNGASGNTAGRRATGIAVIGGPARYDAKHGAVVGGTVSGRKR